MFCKVAFDIALRKVYDYKLPPQLQQAKPGMRVIAPFGTGNTETIGIITEIKQKSSLPAFIKVKEIIKFADNQPLFSEELLPLASYICQKWGGVYGEILFTLVPKTVKQIKGETEIITSTQTNNPVMLLTDMQAKTLVEVNSLTKENMPKQVLFYGAPQSGKTEALIRCCEEPLRQGGQVLFLVPEVFEAGSFFENFKNRFSNCFIWHSKLTPKQRNEIYNFAADGNSGIIVGTRSAALLPFKNLRLIIADEEHDENYVQQDNNPYYNAIDVAVWRSIYNKCPVIMASSTPSLERLKLAFENKITTFDFKEPLNKKTDIEVIFAKKYGKKSNILSDELIENTEKILMAGKKALFIFNRKGTSAVYACSNCGHKPKCECGGEISKEEICLSCDKPAELPEKCPQCGNMIFKAKAGGTQAVVGEIKKFFPYAKTAVLDSASKEDAAQIWQKIKEDGLDIIIGTKIAIRGYNAPQMDLAAFISADTELTLSDFRAFEKTAQLLISARGRIKEGGTLIVQTGSAKEYVFNAAKHGNYLEFALEELKVRKDFSYPPYSRMLRVLAAAECDTLAKAKKTADTLLNNALGTVQSVAADEKLEEGKDYFLTPQKQLFTRKDLESRVHFIVRTENSVFIDKAMRSLEKVKNPKNSKLKIYADPCSFQ